MSMTSRMAMLAAVFAAGQAMAEEPLALTTQKDKASYSVGVNISKGLKQQGADVNTEVLIKGLKDGLTGGKMLMTDDEMKAALTVLQEDMMKKQNETAAVAGDDNKKKGDAFLAENKKKDGVTVLPSGLQYRILRMAAGKKPSASDAVECHYKGTLLNGKEFDSSYKRGQPATFPVNGVIRGWQEALPLMPVGSKWELVIPSDLAYGARGAGREIGPNETLIFEVELLGIK